MKLILALLVCTILFAAIMPAQLAPMSPLGRPPLPGTLQRGPSLTSPMFGPEFLRPFGSWGANSIQAASDDNVKGPVFFTAPTYPAGVNPGAIIAIDLNGDGRNDLVIADQNCTPYPCQTSYVAVLLGNRDGTFQPATDFSVGLGAYSMVDGDLNGDGKIDLAVMNICGHDPECPTGTPATISILLGNGDGTFQLSIEFDTGLPLFSLKSADFNHDGKIDLAGLACSGCGTAQAGIALWLGNGDGTFQSPINVTAGLEPSALAVGDFNRDGSPDLAVTDSTGTVGILLNNGDATFQAPVSYAVGVYPLAVAVGDLNQDGKLDLVVGDECGTDLCEDGASEVDVLLANGDGTFGPSTPYQATFYPTALVIQDLNGDGSADVAASAGDVWLGDGSGHLAPSVTYTAGFGSGITAADFDGNGTIDLAIPNSPGNVVTILSGYGDGSFRGSRGYLCGTDPIYFSAGDFNRDGNPDIAVANLQDQGTGDISILLGDHLGNLSLSGKYVTGSAPYAIAAGDFNADGKLDLAVTNDGSGTVSILLGNGNGTFGSPMNYNTQAIYPSYIVVGDFNRDGKLDLAVTNQQGGSAGLGTVSIFLGNGNGTFNTVVNYVTQNTPEGIVAADFNRDGKLDLVVVNARSTTFSLLLGNGDGTFQPHVDYQLGFTPYVVATADFNGDGNPDIVIPNYGNTLTIVLGNGDGTFQPQSQTPAVLQPGWVTVGDFNRDGKPDLLATSANLFVNLFLGNGDGTFQTPVQYPSGWTTGFPMAVDLNGDSSPDVANVAVSSGIVNVLLNQRGTRMLTSSSQNPSTSGQPVTFTTQVAASLQHLGYAPKGMVKFWDGNTLLGIAPLSHGSASFTTSTLSTGNHKIKTTYGGDGKFNQNKADPVIQKVQ